MSQRQQLEHRLVSAEGDRRTDILLELAPIYYEIDQPLGARLCREQLAHYPMDNLYRAKLLRWVAMLTFHDGDWLRVEQQVTEALAIARKLSAIELEVDLLNILGGTHYRMVNYVQSMDHYLAALSLAEEHSLTNKMAKPLANISRIYADRRQFDIADRFLTRSIAIERELGLDTTVNETALVELLVNQDQPAKALEVIDRVAERLQRVSGILGSNYAISLYYAAESYLMVNEPAKALLLAERAEELLALENARIQMTLNYALKATALMAIGRLPAALAASDEALALVRTIGNTEVESEILRNRAEMLEASGDFRGALAAHKQFKQLSDEVNRLDKDNSTRHLNNKVALAEKSRQLQELQQAQELQSLDRQQEMLLWRLTMVVLILMIVSSIGGIIYIASRKRAAETAYRHLQQTQEQLIESEKMAFSSRWVAGVSQQIHTPLAVVTRVTAMLAERCLVLDPSLERGFTTVENNLQKLTALIGKLREVAKDSSVETWQVVRLAQLFDNCLAPLQSAIARQGITVDIDCDPQQEVYCSSSQLSRVITELVGNTMEHAFEHQNTPCIGLAVRVEEQYVVIRYQDNGQGISPLVTQSIFEAFNTSKFSKGNTGLGLHLAYNLVHQQLHGDIRLVASDEEGTCFDIFLPQQPSMEISTALDED